MTVKELSESIEENRERLAHLLFLAKKQRMSKGRVSWAVRNGIIDNLRKTEQLRKDLSDKLSYAEVIGYEL